MWSAQVVFPWRGAKARDREQPQATWNGSMRVANSFNASGDRFGTVYAASCRSRAHGRNTVSMTCPRRTGRLVVDVVLARRLHHLDALHFLERGRVVDDQRAVHLPHTS